MKNKSLILFVAFFAIALVSCHKKKDTIAKVTVFNSVNNQLVSDCRVVLWGKASQGQGTKDQGDVVLYDTAYTNSGGEAVFSFNKLYQKGMAGVAILNIEAKKGNYKGEGIIKVEEETTSETTVYIQP
jgi:hypothetical protein